MPYKRYQTYNKQKKGTLSFTAMSMGMLFLVLGAIIVSLKLTPATQAGGFKEALSATTQIHFIDVGQGDAVLIKQNDEYMLIDTGEQATFTQLKAHMDKAGVKELKYVLMTHPHSDHMGAMHNVLESYPVGKIIMPNLDMAPMPTTNSFEKLLDAIADKNIAVETAIAGTEYPLGSGALHILATGIKTDNYNELSVSTMFEADGISYLSTGDGENGVEKDLLSNNITIKADIFKGAHHGSKTSNSVKFISKVMPKTVVISCGKDNDYGHPHAQALDSFATVGASVLRTDESGTVIIYSDGKGEYKAATQR